MGGGFSHEALFYRGADDLLSRTVPFLRDGAAAKEPMLVVLAKDKCAALRRELGRDASAVTFADMDEVGRNPARIIPAWRWFVDAHKEGGRSLRGIGEPIGPHRLGAELAECHRHEALLNVAFPEEPPLRLLCPYDVDALDPTVVEEAKRTHPVLLDVEPRPSASYAPVDPDTPFAALLSEPPVLFDELTFTEGPLHPVRDFVATRAVDAGLGERVPDLVLAVNEIATNSIQHGGGSGRLRVWSDDDAFVCELVSGGLIAEPLVGRTWPHTDRENGRGLWMANHLCDLVQVHSGLEGTAIRLLMRT